MIEAAADFLFALEPSVENDVALEFQIGPSIAMVAPLTRSSALKIDAMPLRAMSSVSWY